MRKPLVMAKLHLEAEEVAGALAQDYFELIGLDPADVVGKNAQDLLPLLEGVANLNEKLKRLADCLWLFAAARREESRTSGFALMHAMKLYAMAGAARSSVRVGQDVVDEFVDVINDPIGARMTLEDHLLPMVAQAELTDLIVPVRAQYAVVLAYCGDITSARNEMSALEDYEVDEMQEMELLKQKKLIEQIATSGTSAT